MNAKVIMLAVNFLSSSQGKNFLEKLKGGDSNLAKMLLRGFGQKSPTDMDAGEFIDLAQNFETIQQMNPEETAANIRELMVGKPMDYVIRGIGAVASSATDFIGNKAVNDANKLASAILAGSRGTKTAKQEEIYGKNARERAAEQWAQEKMRRGENVKHATDAIGKFIDKTLGVYEARDDAARAMQAASYLNAPGSLYNYLNGMQSRADKAGGKK